MKIAVSLNVHNDPLTVLDTLDSIKTYMSNDIIVIIDGVSWEKFSNVDLKVPKIKGFVHGENRSPYRNVALSLAMMQKQYPDADWYCYTEYDVLFTSSRFKQNLALAEEKGIWMLGWDGHVDLQKMDLLNNIIGEPLTRPYYLLGCCQFFHKNFMKKLVEIEFFDKFLNLTNNFSNGYFPRYTGYDLSEHMYPTICRQLGGNIGVFAHFDYKEKEWHGSYKYYPVRWTPEIDPVSEDFESPSIMHPLKHYDHPLRVKYRIKREKEIHVGF